ncbi:unnamed protein product [Somion occarium]|uniref:Xylanolytic transcriptional activator regulatory domain-containing protein n=1 Tax=Somion occarium TaxID=3059160 RepID=A0ABP1CIH0_9APHY
MKCDARRPCAGCIRSHAYALAHAPQGIDVPQEPDCTYDEGAEIPEDVETPEDREKAGILENKIKKLETLLRILDWQEDPSRGCSSSGSDSWDWVTPNNHVSPDTNPSSLSEFDERMGSSSNLPNLPVLKDTWPPNIPPLDILRHLAEACFTNHAQTRRLLHAPTFMASLLLDPSDPRFPVLPLLHAVCANGSRYMANSVTAHFLRRSQDDYGDRSFSEEQAMFARSTMENCHTGENLLQYLQASIMLGWYHWFCAKWMDVHVLSGSTLRMAVSLGLNLCKPYPIITPSPVKYVPPFLPPAESFTEEEIRRNVFWMAYAMERLYGCGNSWAMSLSDEEISQMLPVTLADFEAGLPISQNGRQWSHDADLFSRHPEDHTDPFILYIKSVLLLSRVKNMCLRSRFQYYPDLIRNTIAEDPRLNAEFHAIESMVDTFRDTLPAQYKRPIEGEVVDPLLYSVVCTPYIAKIFLHEQFAAIGKHSCLSAFQCITSARAILDLLHSVTTTEYELPRIGLFPVLAWFTAGRVITRFLKAAQRENANDQIDTLQAEITFVLSTIKKLGACIPLARRYALMLDDHLQSMCGEDIAAKVRRMADEKEAAGESCVPPRDMDAPEMQETYQGEAYLAIRLSRPQVGYFPK